MDMGANVERLDEADICNSVFIIDQCIWHKIVKISLDQNASLFVIVCKDVILNQHLLLWDLWQRGKTIKSAY